jgi:hypothetical protein
MGIYRGPRRVRDPRSGTETGRNPYPRMFSGIGTGKFLSCGDQNVLVIPDGDSPVAIPNYSFAYIQLLLQANPTGYLLEVQLLRDLLSDRRHLLQ